MGYDVRRCALSGVVIAWALLIVVAQTYAGDDSITLASASVIKVFVGLTGGLLALIQTLLGFIYISGQRELKEDIKNLYALHKGLSDSKLDKEDHDRLCHKEGGR